MDDPVAGRSSTEKIVEELRSTKPNPLNPASSRSNMNCDSIGSKIFNEWLQAHAIVTLARSVSRDGSAGGNKTVDDLQQEMQRHCLPFCKMAVEEFNMSLAASLRTVHPNKLLLQQSIEGRELTFAKDQGRRLRERFGRRERCSLI